MNLSINQWAKRYLGNNLYAENTEWRRKMVVLIEQKSLWCIIYDMCDLSKGCFFVQILILDFDDHCRPRIKKWKTGSFLDFDVPQRDRHQNLKSKSHFFGQILILDFDSHNTRPEDLKTHQRKNINTNLVEIQIEFLYKKSRFMHLKSLILPIYQSISNIFQICFGQNFPNSKV